MVVLCALLVGQVVFDTLSSGYTNITMNGIHKSCWLVAANETPKEIC